jgi:hypothetical protein
MKRLLLLTAAFALVALAADVTGTWKGTAETQMGKVERSFVFKVDGNKLTGETTSSMTGKSTIADGKIDGDKIEFNLAFTIQGVDVKLHYTGVVKDNQIKLHAESEDGSIHVDYTVDKVS